jgi:hypothetical protein
LWKESFPHEEGRRLASENFPEFSWGARISTVICLASWRVEEVTRKEVGMGRYHFAESQALHPSFSPPP